MADINNTINTRVTVTDAASPTIKGIAESTRSLESQMKRLGGAVAAAFSVKVLSDFARKSIDTALATDRLVRSLAATDIALQRIGKNVSWSEAVAGAKVEVQMLKAMANEYGLTSDQVLNLRKSLAEPLSAFSNMQINDLVPRLAAAGNLFGISPDQIAAEVDAALDSRLKARSADFTKSLGLDVAAINKMTPMQVLAAFSKSLDRLQPALQEYARTNPEASLARAKNDYEDIKTKLGMVILPKLVDFLKHMEKPIADFTAALNSADFQRFLSALATAAGWAVQNPGATVAGGASLAMGTNLAAEVLGGLLLAKIMGAGGKGLGKQLELFGPTGMSLPLKGGLLAVEIAAIAAGVSFVTAASEKRDMSGKWVSLGGPEDAAREQARLRTAWIVELPFSDILDWSRDTKALEAFGNATNKLTESVTDFVSEAEKMQAWIDANVGGMSMTEKIAQAEFGMTLDQLKKWEQFWGGDQAKKISQTPIKVEVELKAEMPYQATLSLSALGQHYNRKVSSRVGKMTETARIGG